MLLGIVFRIDHEVLHFCCVTDLDAQLMRPRRHVERQADHRVPFIVIGGDEHGLIAQPCLRRFGTG